MRIAARMDSIGTETAFEAAARARALEATGRSVIHLEIGEPDFDTPANIREAAKRALDAGFTLPAVPRLPALREAIAADVSVRKDVPSGRPRRRDAGRQAGHVYAMLASSSPATRSSS
jgi:aspartate/methionine/tyrosine aminotransferase